MPTEDELRQGFRLGEWEVLPLRGVLRRDGHEEKPEPRVFGVLIALAKRLTEIHRAMRRDGWAWPELVKSRDPRLRGQESVRYAT